MKSWRYLTALGKRYVPSPSQGQEGAWDTSKCQLCFPCRCQIQSWNKLTVCLGSFPQLKHISSILTPMKREKNNSAPAPSSLQNGATFPVRTMTITSVLNSSSKTKRDFHILGKSRYQISLHTERTNQVCPFLPLFQQTPTHFSPSSGNTSLTLG